MKISFIAWTRYDRRSELLAERLGASIHFISVGRRGSVVWAMFRYIVQALKTWKVLSAERPEIVFVQNPPIPCVLVACLHRWVHGTRFVIDSHTAAFLSTNWSRFLWLHRLLSRKALATIVHNAAQERIVRNWNCPYCVLADPVDGYPDGQPYALGGQFNVAVICVFGEDEPLEIVFEAARRSPQTEFHITGDFRLAKAGRLRDIPANCRLTGFLPYERYLGLLRSVDVVLDLTTRDDTLLCGAFEAVSLGKALIVSDWPILRQYFSEGTVHVPNTADGICRGIEQVRRGRSELELAIRNLRDRLSATWQERFSELQAVIGAC